MDVYSLYHEGGKSYDYTNIYRTYCFCNALNQIEY